MALTKCNVPSDVIGSLATRAEERGLTPQEFKDKFDEMPEGIKQYINEVLTEEIDAHIADYLVHKAESVSDSAGVHGLEIEEGTWTPILIGTTTAGDNVYSRQVGRYIRVGKLVSISFTIRLTEKSSELAGSIRIAGLPFNTSGFPYEKSVSISRYGGISIPTGRTQLAGAIESNYITLYGLGSEVVPATLTSSSIADNAEIMGTATYQIN